MPNKIIKTGQNDIDTNLTSIIDKGLNNNKFLENAKTVRPLHKKNSKL